MLAHLSNHSVVPHPFAEVLAALPILTVFFLVWLLLYAHRHQSILGAAGHIILTTANQLMEE
jgi:hypothetical protein